MPTENLLYAEIPKHNSHLKAVLVLGILFEKKNSLNLRRRESDIVWMQYPTVEMRNWQIQNLVISRTFELPSVIIFT